MTWTGRLNCALVLSRVLRAASWENSFENVIYVRKLEC